MKHVKEKMISNTTSPPYFPIDKLMNLQEIHIPTPSDKVDKI